MPPRAIGELLRPGTKGASPTRSCRCLSPRRVAPKRSSSAMKG